MKIASAFLTLALLASSAVPQVPSFTTPTFVIPAVARLDGRNGSDWRTQLLVWNRSDSTVSLSLSFKNSQVVGEDDFRSVQIRPGTTVFDNIMVEVFHRSSALGALIVQTSSSDIFITSRTFNVAAAESAAEEVPAYTPQDFVTSGERAIVFAPADPSSYRFNYGVFAISVRARVDIRILNRDGSLRRSDQFFVAPPPPEYSFHFHPAYHVQWALPDATGGDVVEIHVLEGAVVLYGSAVSESTGHPLFSPQIRLH